MSKKVMTLAYIRRKGIILRPIMMNFKNFSFLKASLQTQCPQTINDTQQASEGALHISGSWSQVNYPSVTYLQSHKQQ